MTIIGKYDEFNVDIEGSAESLRELSRAILGVTGSEILSLTLPHAPPTPYLGYAKSLRINPDEGKVCISRIEDEIIISGSLEKLAIFAHNIEHLAKQQKAEHSVPYKEHLHIEYHPDHFYLKKESTPLTITSHG